MGRLSEAGARAGLRLPQDGSRTSETEVGELLLLIHSADPAERQLAVRNLCTCHLKADYPSVGDALLPMLSDPHPKVRREVLHALTDSAPWERVPKVVDALESLWNDADVSLRRRVRRILGHYRRTGKLTDTPD